MRNKKRLGHFVDLYSDAGKYNKRESDFSKAKYFFKNFEKNNFITAFTLIEIIVVVAIFGIILGSLLAAITRSDRFFIDSIRQSGLQFEARRAVDRIAWELKESNPSWKINGNTYSVSINAAGDELNFYLPSFDDQGKIIKLTAVRYYVRQEEDNTQLMRRQGSGQPTVVANNIDTQSRPYFEPLQQGDNSILRISLPVINNNIRFRLRSSVTLRNRNTTLDSGTEVEEITEGES